MKLIYGRRRLIISVYLAFRSCHCEPKGRGNLAFHKKQRRDCFALARNDKETQQSLGTNEIIQIDDPHYHVGDSARDGKREYRGAAFLATGARARNG